MHLQFVLETASLLLLLAAKCSSFIAGDWHKYEDDSPRRTLPEIESALWEQPEMSRELKELNCPKENFIRGLFHKSVDISQVIITVRCNFEEKSFFAHSEVEIEVFDSDPTGNYTGNWQRGMRLTHPKVFPKLGKILLEDPRIKLKVEEFNCDSENFLEDMYYDLANISQFIVVIKCNNEQKFLFTRAELVLGAKNETEDNGISIPEKRLWKNPEISRKLREANCASKDKNLVQSWYMEFSGSYLLSVVINCNNEQKLLFVYIVFDFEVVSNISESDNSTLDFQQPAEKLSKFTQYLRQEAIISWKLLLLQCEGDDFLENWNRKGNYHQFVLVVNCGTGRKNLEVYPKFIYEGFDSNPTIDIGRRLSE